MKRAVVLCSGGLDSTVSASIARERGYELFLLSIYYGQRHAAELKRVPDIAKALGAKKSVRVEMDLRVLGGSALTDDLPVPKGRDPEEIREEIPATYVPARNSIFLSIALGWAEVVSAEVIYFGANIIDYSGYPDCRPEFLSAFEAIAKVGTKAGVQGSPIRVEAPLLNMTKAEIIKCGHALGAPLHLTSSCYDPDAEGRACGQCDSCRLRLKGFSEVGREDPICYR